MNEDASTPPSSPTRDELTTYPPAELAEWVRRKAEQEKRSVSKMVELILEDARRREQRAS